MWPVFSSIALFVASTSSFTFAQKGNFIQDVSRFNSITFGDSYTDENRIIYFYTHIGSAPPAGTFLPESFSTPSGGRTWPRYVVQYTGHTVNGAWSPQLTLYNYAVSGAVCSNFISPRCGTHNDLFIFKRFADLHRKDFYRHQC